ncbi:MAG: DUF167 family protein [Rickettsiales bacterium]|jgi:uncharacterized protein (TIGR00251 family)|nr:DUF167 family protein [Rickettsiales bacterium]
MIKFNEPFEIKVQTKARKNEITDGEIVKVKVTEIPENGKANKAIIELFSKTYKIAKNNIEIIKGETNNKKLIILNHSTTSIK